ncbi:MAG TPA: hypothetical protein VD788_05280, partial [Candidatus Polarisedimenticolaceae bacterium]|nr:hypothetical protein [Candidatus Polarisedimenticolaceae bacterium]
MVDRLLAAGLALAGLTSAAPVAALDRQSPRNANYTIEVRLDPVTRMLAGRQRLTWRNIRTRPTSELWFHLYWNAWRNDRSSWMLERRLSSPRDDRPIRADDWGFVEVDSIRM